MKPLASARSKAGITLIEMLVTVVLIGVILAVAVPSITGLIERRRVVAAAGEIANIFAYARSEANVAATEGKGLTLHLEEVPTSITEFGSCIRLSIEGANDTCYCNRSSSKVCKSALGKAVLLREFTLPRSQSVSFEASATAWGPNGRIVSFQRDVHRTAVQGLVVKVTGSRTGSTLNVEYNNAGRVRICSPNGAIGGFPVCA